MDKLSGDEDYQSGMDWFKELINLTEITMPGAGAILKATMDRTEPIDSKTLNDMSDPMLSNILSRDLHGLLYRKNNG